MTALAPILEAFFTERLAQRGASGHTVASYRDTFCLLLRYADQQLGKRPSSLDLSDCADLVIMPTSARIACGVRDLAG